MAIVVCFGKLKKKYRLFSERESKRFDAEIGIHTTSCVCVHILFFSSLRLLCLNQIPIQNENDLQM